MSETAGFQRVVVGVVGALQARRGLRGFIERPAQRRRSLAGEFPDPAGLIRAGTPMSIPANRTALRELDIRVTSPSSVKVTRAMVSPTPNWVISAWQPAWWRAILRSSRSSSWIYVSGMSIMRRAITTRSFASSGSVRLARNFRPLGLEISPGAPRAQTVVIQGRADPKQPLGALIDQRLAQVQPRAPLADVLRRDP